MEGEGVQGMSKVWILWDCTPYEESWIKGVFSSEERREEYIQANDYRTPIRKQLKAHLWTSEEDVDPKV